MIFSLSLFLFNGVYMTRFWKDENSNKKKKHVNSRSFFGRGLKLVILYIFFFVASPGPTFDAILSTQTKANYV